MRIWKKLYCTKPEEVAQDLEISSTAVCVRPMLGCTVLCCIFEAMMVLYDKEEFENCVH